MKITSEVKIGTIGIVTAAIIFWGIHFLLGNNILKSKNIFYATYELVNGLEPAAPVLMQGYKIGIISDVYFNPEASPPFIVTIEIEKRYGISSGSVAEIYSSDLLGSKAIRINSSDSKSYHQVNDTLLSALIPDMLSRVMDEVTPVMMNIAKLTNTLDSVGVSLIQILNDPDTREIIKNINKISGSIQESLSDDGKLGITFDNLSSITTSLKNQNEAIASTIKNLQSLSSDIENANMDSILNNLASVTQNLNNISSQIESGEGTIGKLLYNDSLYDHISSLSADLDSLILDINNHPEKYVRFSLFGK